MKWKIKGLIMKACYASLGFPAIVEGIKGNWKVGGIGEKDFKQLVGLSKRLFQSVYMVVCIEQASRLRIQKKKILSCFR